jgi:tripartite ATP-independent transporter DctM subunit
MIESYTPLYMILILIMMIMLGHPVAFTVAGVAMLFGVLYWGGAGVFDVLAKNVFGVMDNYIFTAIPMFVFMGAVLERSGIGEIMYSAMHKVMGGLRGGLSLATIFICTLFAASTGIIATGIITMGLLALPAMLKRQYDRELAAGAVMAGGTLGILIPPSIMLIVMGALASLSVGKLFMAAVFPGLILSLLYMVFIALFCYLKPGKGPALPLEERNLSVKEKVKISLTSISPSIGLIFAVLGSIFFGIASPTEAASVGALGAVFIAISYRKLSWRILREACYETMLAYGMIIWILIGANCYASVFLGIRGDAMISKLLLGLELNRWLILAIILTIIFILGMVMEWIAIVIIGMPIFLPIVTALKFEPLWFSVLFAVVLQTGFLTPPYGGALFILKGIAPQEISMSHIWRGAYLFIPFQVITVILCVLFPQIILWLPSLMIK